MEGLVKKFDAALHGEYSPDAESAAKRMLKNRALQLLTATGDPAFSKELLVRFREASNMTDTIAALTALIDTEGRSSALKAPASAQTCTSSPLELTIASEAELKMSNV